MKQLIAVFCLICIFYGCSTLTLAPCDFSWPVESVLKVNNNGVVQDGRYSFSVNVKPLLFAETKDSSDAGKWSIRVIRDGKGYFYFTASKFKNVYVFEQTEAGLKLSKTIFISEAGLETPALNQRAPYIQLLNGEQNGILLSHDGIKEGDKK